jgi:hypothetical protein
MCWHCNDWWPVNDLGRALLGLDAGTPYWVHGLHLVELQDVCHCVVAGAAPHRALEPALAWLRERCPDYAERVRSALGERCRGLSGLDMYDQCYCEPDPAESLRLRCPGTTNGSRLEDAPAPAPVLWTPAGMRDLPAPAVKMGRIQLQREAGDEGTARPDARYYFE